MSSRSSNSASLKQGTLIFPSNKRSHSNASLKPKAKAPRTASSSSPIVEVVSSSSGSDSEGLDDPIENSSDDEYVQAPVPQTKAAAVSKSSTSKVLDRGKVPLKPRESFTGGAIDLRAENAGRWRKHYGEVREKMGNLPPIHDEGQNKVNHILRVFDTSFEYGPCVGVTRLERWERAKSLGLNPPVEVFEILSTKQGLEEDEFKQSVFYGMV